MRVKEILSENHHKFTTAYHITTVESAEDIAAVGLTPDEGRVFLVVDAGDNHKLKEDLRTVAGWMLAKTEQTEDPLTLLKVDVSGIPLDYHNGWWTSLVNIPPSRIADLGERAFNRVA